MRQCLLVTPLLILAACSDGTSSGSEACPQTFEFGNFGCARIQGAVRDAAGQPIANARVSVGPPEDTPNTYDSPSADTDESGVYSLEIHQYQQPATPKAADTVPMYLRAFLLGEEPPVSDSLLVDMVFFPVGAVPEPAEEDITLAE